MEKIEDKIKDELENKIVDKLHIISKKNNVMREVIEELLQLRETNYKTQTKIVELVTKLQQNSSGWDI